SRVSFSQDATFDYLYRMTFVRGGDYLGMYVRLIVLGGLAIYFVPSMWMQLIFGLLFLYMAIFQLMALYHHHRTVMWLDLYPVKGAVRRGAVLKLLLRLGIVQTILFTLLFLADGSVQGALMMLAGGSLFTVLFIRGYVWRKIAG